MIRWVVRSEDPRNVGGLAVVAPDALAEGRVFVGRTRALSPDTPVAAGDVVSVHAARGGQADVTILFRADGLVAVDKPSDLPTTADHRTSAQTLVAETERAIGAAQGTLHATSRLDVGVSGVVVFAVTAEARKRLDVARSEGTYRRTYVAIGRGRIADEGAWTAPIGKARDPRIRAAFGRGAEPAETSFAALARTPSATLFEARPRTGRTHQIRVHASHAGHALFGDHAYGGDRRVVDSAGRVTALSRIALHAWEVAVPAANGAVITVRAALPTELATLWELLGGAAADTGPFEPERG